MITRLLIVLGCLAWLWPAPALADSPAVAVGNTMSGTETPVDMHPELKRFLDAGGRVDFMGHEYGLDGWLITNKKGERKFAYTTPAGGLVLGLLIGPDGKMVTEEQVRTMKERLAGGQAAAPGGEKSTVNKAERLYAAVENTAWVAIGSQDAPYLYMFLNTGCDHCQEYWKQLQGAVQAGLVQVRLIPFGKQEENRNAAAALLSVDNPTAVWSSFVAGDASVLAKSQAKDAEFARVDGNTALFRDWKLGGPPFTIYRRPLDGKVMIMAGMPENAMAVLADVTTKPAAPSQSSEPSEPQGEK